MAKKASKSADENDSAERRQVKFWLSPEDHHRLRIAAAVSDQTMADLCSEAVMARVNELTSGVRLPRSK